MENNLFPVSLIGFLLLIVFLLSKTNKPKEKLKNKKKHLDTQPELNDSDKILNQQIWHQNRKGNTKIQSQDLLFSNEWQKQFREYNKNNTSNTSSLALSSETFNNTSFTFLNKNAQEQASAELSTYLDKDNSPIPAADSEHYHKLQQLDYFY
jgi:hypothetical protein